MRELELSSTVVTDQKRAAELVSALHKPSSRGSLNEPQGGGPAPAPVPRGQGIAVTSADKPRVELQWQRPRGRSDAESWENTKPAKQEAKKQAQEES